MERPIMYVDHFNLTERTFTNGPDKGFFLPNEHVDGAIARLREVMLGRDSMAVVTGGPGVGKSAFVAAALATIEDRAIVANIDLRHSEAECLTDMLLLALGAQAGDGNTAEALHRLRIIIGKHNDEGRRVTAVIDLSGMTVDRARRILQLIHLAGEPGGQLNVVLLGPHALHRLLNAPGLIHLRQRVCYRYRVRPLTLEEVDRYLEEQFERAGGNVSAILKDGAADTVFRFVGGVPRLINTLMDAVLSEAAVRYLEAVGPELINEVAKELGWKPLAGGLPRAVQARAAQQQPAAAARPPELPLAQEVSTPAEPPPPFSEATAAMLLDPQAVGGDHATAARMPEFPKATDKFGDRPGMIPEMSASDTSATGMLRLEDLEAHFAETIFGEDATAAASDAIAATPPEIPDSVAS